MATLAENIENMADLVAKIKKSTRLSENSILRIVDMNLAMAQQNGPMGQLPDDTDLPMVDPEEFTLTNVESDNVVTFPEPDPGEDAVISAATEE